MSELLQSARKVRPVPLLHCAGVAKAYGPVVALRGVDLDVAPGSVHALLGANGAGKSTLVKILNGVLRRDSGAMEVHGRPVELRTPAAARGAGLAPVFQDPAMIGDLTVEQNLKLTGADVTAVRRELAGLDLDGIDLGEQVRDLPLPFLRMLDLARALASEPELLLLDEMTAALPPDLSERVFAVMAAQRARGRSVLFISHRLAEVRAHCDMATVLRDGVDVDAFAPADSEESRIVSAMLGETASVVATSRRQELFVDPGPPRLEVRQVPLDRSGSTVSFSVAPGEVLGVTALEGQGQDRLFDLLSGNARLPGGQLLLDGSPLRIRHPYDAVRRGLVLVPSDRALALLPQRSIRENIAVPEYNRPSRWGPLSASREKGRVADAVQRLSIDTRAAAQARRLSGGNQQKLTIGRWLASGRTLLLFDPTRGIDVGAKHQVYELVRELAEDGAAVIMYTSELREIGLVCDRAVVLHDGEVVAELPSTAGEDELLTAAHGRRVAA